MGSSNLSTCLTMSIIRLGDTTGKQHFAAMMEVGVSTKIISLMMDRMDFTEYITAERYLDLLMHTSYKKHLIPRTMQEFRLHPEFERFRERMQRGVPSGPPPVLPRIKKEGPDAPEKKKRGGL